MTGAEAGRATQRVATLLLATLLLVSPAAQGQPGAPTAPDTQAMIRALNPLEAGRTRNLVVRLKPGADAASTAATGAGWAASAPAPAPAPPSTAALAATAAPAAAPAPVADTPPPQLSLALPFEAGSSRLQLQSAPLLGQLVAALLSPEPRTHRFAIEGHTDAQGQPAQNLRLSQARAEEVRQYLVALGIAPERLVAVGKGSSQPANPQDPRAAENRRVRVLTLP